MEQFDAIAWHKQRTFAVELKHRFIPINKYKTLFIEDYKFASLMLEYIINKREPLYVNILHTNHLEQIEKQLKREPRELPQMIIHGDQKILMILSMKISNLLDIIHIKELKGRLQYDINNCSYR